MAKMITYLAKNAKKSDDSEDFFVSILICMELDGELTDRDFLELVDTNIRVDGHLFGRCRGQEPKSLPQELDQTAEDTE